MGFYAGLDVSLERIQICVVDDGGAIIWRGWPDTQLEKIAAKPADFADYLVRADLETGSLGPWLHRGLKALGLPVVCMDARRAADAIKARAVRPTRRTRRRSPRRSVSAGTRQFT